MSFWVLGLGCCDWQEMRKQLPGGQTNLMVELFNCTQQGIIDINIIQLKQSMEAQNYQRKYSKISPALKCCFLQSLYHKDMTIKEAANRCKLNYSTAKVIIRDLTQKQKRYVNKLVKSKETQSLQGKPEHFKNCQYRIIGQPEEQAKEFEDSLNTRSIQNKPIIEIISRVSHDFFREQEKSE